MREYVVGYESADMRLNDESPQGKTLEDISVLFFEKESFAHEAHLREQQQIQHQHQRSLSHSGGGSHHSISHQEPSCCGRYQTAAEAPGADDCRWRGGAAAAAASAGGAVGRGDETV